MKNIVYGINDDQIAAEDTIITAASCTTNAIAPVLKVVNDRFGIVKGHVETVHAYTNDQNLIDNYHKGSRRGRSAALNMVLTETGAAKAVVKAIPELGRKIDRKCDPRADSQRVYGDYEFDAGEGNHARRAE